eukprot:11200153-Lingulodinium_polyedra.AAC.1
MTQRRTVLLDTAVRNWLGSAPAPSSGARAAAAMTAPLAARSRGPTAAASTPPDAAAAAGLRRPRRARHQ